jgi:hypothetical protein
MMKVEYFSISRQVFVDSMIPESLSQSRGAAELFRCGILGISAPLRLSERKEGAGRSCR